MTISKALQLLAIFSATAQIFCACSKETPPPVYDAPLFESQSDYRERRTLDFVCGREFSAVGAAVGFSETKNIARLFFTDLQRAFTEVDFFADGKKCKIVSRRHADENSAKFELGNGGTLELKRLGDATMRLEAAFSGAKTVSMSFILPNEFFVSTTADVGGVRFAIADNSAKPPCERFEKFGKITLRADTRENAFSISDETGNASCAISFGRNFTRLSFSSGGKLALRFDLGSEKVFSPAPPDGDVCTKIGHVDYWLEERAVLPDTRGKNLLQNPSFEAGLRNMAFRHFLLAAQNEKLWEIKPVHICETDAKFGKKSLEIFSDAPNAYLAQKVATSSVALERGTYTFSVWAKSDSDGQSLAVSVVDAAKLYDRKNWHAKTFKLERDWKRFEFTFEIDKPQIVPLVFEASSASPAVCRLDGMQLERGAKATDFEPPSADAFFESDFEHNLIEHGKPAGARIAVVAAPNAKGRIDAEIFDFFGERVFSKRFDFECGADGVAKIPLPVEKFGRGLFVLKTRAAADGGSERYEISRFAVVDFLENKHKHKNLFVDTYVDPLSTQQNFPEILAWYKKLGYGARAGYTNRDNLISHEAKKYGIDSLSSPVGRITRDKQIGRAFVFLENTNWFSIPNMRWKKALLLDDFRRGGGDLTPEYLAKVEKVAEYITRKYDGVEVWENAVEPEGAMKYFANPVFATRENFEKFVEIECAVARGIRKGNPSARLSTSITSTLAREDRITFFDRLLEETAKRGVKYDCAGAHIYRGAPEYPRPTLDENYERLFDVFKKHGYENIDVYSPEGMHWLPVHCYDVPFITDLERRANPLRGVLPYTYDIGHGERLATALRARTWLVGLKYANIKSMNASNYGVSQMDAALSPYAYHIVPNTLGNLLGESKFLFELKLFADTRCFVFDDGKGGAVAAIWACKKEFDRGTVRPPEMSFSAPRGTELFDIMGHERSFDKNADGSDGLRLSIFPVFLRAANADELAAALKAAKWKSNAPTVPNVKFMPLCPDGFSVAVENPYAAQMCGKIGLRGDSQSFAIAENDGRKFAFKSPAKISGAGIKKFSEKISLSLSSPVKRDFTFAKSFHAVLVKNADSDFGEVGSNWDKWEKVAPLKLDNMRRSEKLWRNAINPTAAQFSAQYKILRDGDKLRVAVFVRDDKFLEADGGSADAGAHADTVEIIFDALANATDTPEERRLGSDDWHFKIWKQKGSDVAKVYRLSVPDVQLTLGILGAKVHTFADDVKGAFQRTADGYRLELEFEATAMLPQKLDKNAVMGVGVIVDDFDDAKSPEADARLTNSAAKTKIESTPAEFPLAVFE